MRRMTWTAAIILCLSLVLAACGTKDAESVVKELDKVVNSMESYQGSGTMTLRTGQQPLEYKVEVSYQKPQYYRIKLTNEEKDITQIVLRNDDGVFVLTPKLNKVFRFQSDWPQNQGQVYLYQTLVQSILVDNSRQFVIDEDNYVFDVMANYNNGSLARQKIWLNKADYKPVQVEVSDTNAAVMVEVKFDNFDFGPKFDKAVFETEANMKATPSSQTTEEPTMALPDDESTTGAAEGNVDDADADANAATNGNIADDAGTDANAATDGDKADDAGNQTDVNSAVDGDDQTNNSGNAAEDEGDDAATSVKPEEAAGFTAMKPSYLPAGVQEPELIDIVFGGNPGLMLRYSGDYSYTLIQTEPKDQAASLVPGTILDLGFTVGEVSGDEQQTLTWTYEGHQFRLTSANLPESEMIKVAQSVQGEIGK
ncbi:outer membrane lipoprotein-sorting protein [Paenibacillus endophyticus]|uniref:Outer membrane lipoprotein-sorting protein n=1 Tax=Paenibacillus endophyticus TaxID=1294268 RepID=A0A7W5C7V1_9BACL|nr:outer membrane lipoprotein-sorting protein [Paenibacillus endophyticus]MBB3152587.1 outer membrane lipoprotein-sorting protein [Paenibacillus endophyticus]